MSLESQETGQAPEPPTVAPPAAVPKPQPKVMICIPSGRTWEARTATSIVGLSCYSILQGIQIGIINLEGSMITKQRNDLVEMALKQEPDYILFIDSDMTFPANALIRLLAHNKEVVGATYNKRVPPYETLGRLKGAKPSDEELAKGGLYPADLLPGGFLLIKASVFSKLPWPWFYETYQWPGENGEEAFKNMMRGSFAAVPDEELLATLSDNSFMRWLNTVHKMENASKWAYMSEDLQFCRRCAKANVDLWCDLALTFEMVHLGTQSVTCKSTAATPQESMITPAVM